MGYIKAIIYGSHTDLYTYERDIRSSGAGSRKSASRRVGVPGVGSDGVVEVVREQVQKRFSNLRRAELDFKRLVVANLGFAEPPALVTMSYAENQTNPREAEKDFRSFIGSLRYRFGKSFRYISVSEFQERGAVHYHTLFWGLPTDLCLTERDTRFFASIWGRGFVDVALTDGNPRLATYLSKYMSKSFLDSRLFGLKVYSCSRNVVRPLVEKNLGGLFYLEQMYGIGSVENPPCYDKTYDSKWLGKGRFRLYQNNTNIT